MLDHAIEEVRALTRALGLETVPTVLADRSNLVLALDPHPLVARVAMATSASRVGVTWLRREVEVSRYLGPRLTTQPAASIEAGPYEHAGLVISFWRRETLLATRAPYEAGRTLAEAHRALRNYPMHALPYLGAWEEARAVHERARGSEHLAESQRHTLERAFDRAQRVVEEIPARSASIQAVHGDAHLGNVLSTTRGVLWTDWEDAFIGPIEHDLACLRSKAELFGEEREAIDAACAAYDVEHDAELVRDLGLVRNVQVIVWLAVFAERQPELVPRLHARIARL